MKQQKLFGEGERGKNRHGHSLGSPLKLLLSHGQGKRSQHMWRDIRRFNASLHPKGIILGMQTQLDEWLGNSWAANSQGWVAWIMHTQS